MQTDTDVQKTAAPPHSVADNRPRTPACALAIQTGNAHRTSPLAPLTTFKKNLLASRVYWHAVSSDPRSTAPGSYVSIITSCTNRTQDSKQNLSTKRYNHHSCCRRYSQTRPLQQDTLFFLKKVILKVLKTSIGCAISKVKNKLDQPSLRLHH